MEASKPHNTLPKQDFLKVKGRELELDRHGYLANYEDWSENVALAFAEQEDLALNDKHWEVIRFVREFYETYDTSPAIRALVKAMKEQFGPEVGNSRYLHRLFPDGPAKIATKLAGLPKPAKCL
uniref:TusE/DsrC/DsvC family sulfur relay protein n=1 Tax=Ningiella ruwaisensis TaxID=2364274 RepID=UPI00109EF5FB|nr:TusE/DsrC/DsvC family sulfur relay protein [Ningiella ruwaisensis]